MKKLLLRSLTAASLASVALSASAVQGAPHSVSGSSLYSTVRLQWQSPATDLILKWHDGTAYNGESPVSFDSHKPCAAYFGAKFTADDLALYVGKTINAVQYCQYYQLAGIEVSVLRDGEVVAHAVDDPNDFVAKRMKSVPVTPVTIEAGHEYMVVLKQISGYNQNFVGYKDAATSATGKSDLMSYDGKNWVSTNSGDYLVGAVLGYENSDAPTAYKVYCDGTAVEGTLGASALACSVDGQTPGQHSYQVAAVFADGKEELSAPVKLNIDNFSGAVATTSFYPTKVDDLNVSLSWHAPQSADGALTWSNLQYATQIGGSATSNTKLWIRNHFEVADMPALSGASIKAINIYFADATVSKGTLWVMRDGVLVYKQDLTTAEVGGIQAGAWSKFQLTTPYVIEGEHTYSYGIYALHTPKTKPFGVDNTAGVNIKGNCFSTSSPNTTNFLNTKPTWTALQKGDIAGNWMMTADIEGGAARTGYTYSVQRNGQTVASGLTTPAFTDAAPAPGYYEYSVTAQAQGVDAASVADKTGVQVKLPFAYSEPQIVGSAYDEKTGLLQLAWNMDKSLSHHGDAAYVAGFAEELPLMWGAQFKADMLSRYAGMQISKLKVILGAEIGDFKVGVYTAKGQALSEISLKASEIEPLAFYTIDLPTPVAITGTEDLYVAYSGTIPAGKNALIIDKGPLVDGGARVSLTNGLTWMNLGTVASTFNNYNIVIGALASEPGAPANARGIELGRDIAAEALPVSAVERNWGVDALSTVAAVQAPAKAPARAKAAKYNVFCNGQLMSTVTEPYYEETVKRFADFDYYVTAVYTNGWESAESRHITFSRTVDQRNVAPYGLNAEVADGKAVFSWKSPAESVKLSYVTSPEAEVTGLGITGTNPTTHCITKYSIADLQPYVGHKVDHIQFMPAAPMMWADVIVSFGENIIYRQPYDGTIADGGKLVDVRLSEPVEIPANTEVGVGYIAQYGTGLKPLGGVPGAVAGYGDIITSGGGSGTWASLLTKNKLDYNWYINAILAQGDKALNKVAARTAAAVTYNLYRDGQLLQQDIAGTSVTVDAAHGLYHVTAVENGVETGSSNAVRIVDNTGVSDIEAGADNAPAVYYTLQGVRIDTPNAPGVYLRRQGNTTAKVVVK